MHVDVWRGTKFIRVTDIDRYPPQLKYIFRLVGNVSRVAGLNSLNPWDEQNSLTPKENNNLNFPFTRDQVLLLKNRGKFASQPASPNDLFSVCILFLGWEI